MATGTTPTMTVLHLEGGNVLGAATTGSRKVTVADLTGSAQHLAVRLPDPTDIVKVPADLLTATEVPRDDDVLSRPWDYRLGSGTPALTYVGAPIDLKAAAAPNTLPAAVGSKVVSIWQTADDVEVVEGVVDATLGPTGNTPPGATHRLVACLTGPLAFEPSP
jgi:hypothetical protein